MLFRLLESLTVFDWISPTIAILQNIANHPSHTFLVPVTCGWSGLQIQQLLQRNGIRVWGRMTVNHTFMLTVRRKQAAWAQYLLQRAGIPIQHGLVERPQRAPTAPTEADTHILDRVNNGIDEFARSLGF